MNALPPRNPRGRPRKDAPPRHVPTAAERAAQSDEALLVAGGRILRAVRIQPGAANALDVLVERYGTVTAAVQAALIALAKRSHRPKLK